MLFMVIEHFREGRLKDVGERFARHGRMLPDGVTYHASWMEPTGRRCFQVMEALNHDVLDEWANRWSDLVDFEIIPVLTSAEFWSESGPA